MNNFYGGRKGRDFNISGLYNTKNELKKAAEEEKLDEGGFYIITTSNDTPQSHLNEVYQWTQNNKLQLVFHFLGLENGGFFVAPTPDKYDIKEEINQ